MNFLRVDKSGDLICRINNPVLYAENLLREPIFTIHQRVVAITTYLPVVILLYICGCVNDMYVQIKALNTSGKMKYRRRLKRNTDRKTWRQARDLGEGRWGQVAKKRTQAWSLIYRFELNLTHCSINYI